MNRCIILLLLATSACAQSSTEDSLAKIIREGQAASPYEQNLRRLTDEIGGRVPGTPAMDKAVDWAVANFKAAGADSVTTESFTIARSWQEGATAVNVTSPVQFKVRAVSTGWSPPLVSNSLSVVDVGFGKEADLAKAGDVSGKLMLVHTELLKTLDDLLAEYARDPPILAAALKGKAAGVMYMASRDHDLLYRHIAVTVPGELAVLPLFTVAHEDGERIARLIAAGNAVKVNVNMPNRVGPAIQSKNVIAEIRGTEKPSEFVILGAHLDSWELGTGALDNGCNAAMVIDALRAIKASGVRPRRSIRFMLYSGEEQGIIGSRAWARQHAAELDSVVADIVFDEGSGATTGYMLSGRNDIKAAVERLTAPLRPLGVTEMTTDAFDGTDNIHLVLEGVPTLVANQKESNYMDNYHAESDTFDKVDIPQMKKHVAIAAATAFAIADSPERIGKRQSVQEVEALIQHTNLEPQLKAFGHWEDWQQIRKRRSAK